ncbi:MAG: chemotaxis protein CheW [Cyanobacteria bacterium P01_H01_bin.58]
MATTPSIATTPDTRLQQLLPQLFQPETQSGERYLKFDIAPNLPALIALEDVQESAQVPSHRITPLPNLPACILGLMNVRNQVLCIVDLAQVLQIPTLWSHRQDYSVVTIRLASTPETAEETNLLSLMLHDIQGIVRLQPEAIESSVDAFVPTLMPFLQGCVVQGAKSLPILDVNAIAAAPALKPL